MGLKLAGAIFALLLVAGSYYLAYSKGYSAGESAVKAAVASATSQAQDEAAKGILAAGKATQAAEDAANAAPASDDGPIAPVLRRELDRP